MQRKSIQALAYSTAGVLVLFVILLLVNYIAGALRARADLTHGNVFTLTDGTRKVLAGLSAPIKIRYYASTSENAMPVTLKSYAHRVEDLLREYRQQAKGKIVLEKYDPLPDSDAEDSANLDGVEPQVLETGEQFYLGLSIARLDQRVSIPVLAPNRENLLEYDLTRAIAQISRTEKPVIGIMSALPVFGTPVAMPGANQQEPWAFVQELRRDYDVKELTLSVDRIEDNIKLLVVIHPRDIKESTQYAIDQFVLRGGKLIAFLDTYAYFDQIRNPTNPMMQMGGGASNLDKLLTAWGLTLEPRKLVGDLRFMRRDAGARGLATVLYLADEAFNVDDVVTSQVGNMIVPFAGAFSGKPAAGLTQTVLIKSSGSAQLMDALTATMPSDSMSLGVTATGVEYPIALRLSGKFKTAFAEGKPKAEPKPDADPANPPPPPAPDTAQLKESARENSVVLVADVDLLSNQASVQVANMLGQRVLIPISGNLNFVQSLVELYSGDENLINLRSRQTQFRPLTVVQKKQAKAAEAYASEIRTLETSLTDTQRRIAELQKTKAEGQQFVLSPEQKAELENFRKKQAETRQSLKQLRKTLRAETDALETWTKVINIGAMPLLVALAGIGLALVKKRRVAAR